MRYPAYCNRMIEQLYVSLWMKFACLPDKGKKTRDDFIWLLTRWQLEMLRVNPSLNDHINIKISFAEEGISINLVLGLVEDDFSMSFKRKWFLPFLGYHNRNTNDVAIG